MQVKSYPIESLHSFSKLLIDYLAEFPALTTFYGNAPQLESFEQQILEKKLKTANNSLSFCQLVLRTVEANAEFCPFLLQHVIF